MKLSSIVPNTILPTLTVVVSYHHIHANEYHTDDGNVAFSAELDFHEGFTIDDLHCPGHTHPHTDFVTSSMAVHMVDYMNNEMGADMTLLEVLQGIEIFEDEGHHYSNNDDDDDNEQRRGLGGLEDGGCTGMCEGFVDIPTDAWRDSWCSWDQVERGSCYYYYYFDNVKLLECLIMPDEVTTLCQKPAFKSTNNFVYHGGTKCKHCWSDDFDKRRKLRSGHYPESLEEHIARGVKRDINEKCTGEQELNMVKTLHFTFDLY